MQAGCDHLWVCVAVTTNGCFLRQVVPRRHTCHDVHFKWESVSTAEVHCQLIEIHGEDVFNPQNQSCDVQNMEVGSGDALERREVHPKAFMSQKPLHAISCMVSAGSCTGNQQSIVCSDCDDYFPTNERFMLPTSTWLGIFVVSWPAGAAIYSTCAVFLWISLDRLCYGKVTNKPWNVSGSVW